MNDEFRFSVPINNIIFKCYIDEKNNVHKSKRKTIMMECFKIVFDTKQIKMYYCTCLNFKVHDWPRRYYELHSLPRKRVARKLCD